MNADEIIDGLEEISSILPHSLIPNAAIDLIESLQSQLTKEKRRAEKAVADLKYIAVCETCKKSGITEYPEIAVIQCEYYDSEYGCGQYEWRGAEEGD
jgi:hypothetical protein